MSDPHHIGERLRALPKDEQIFVYADPEGGMRYYPSHNAVLPPAQPRWLPVCDHRHIDDLRGALDCAEKARAQRGHD